MKVLIIPDSFKGTMSSVEICEILKERVEARFPHAQAIALPVADGGEGSVEAFLQAVGGRRVETLVKGPYLEEMTSFYGILPDEKTAVIEMAAAAGLPLVGANLQAEKTSTYGVGQLMAHATGQGCTKIILGLGGSATNDFGCGAAAALGVKFLDDTGQAFLPTGESLSKVHTIDKTGILPGFAGIELVTMCDIDNPLYGKNGAAYVFGPQKGADGPMVEFLDGQLQAIAQKAQEQLGVDVSNLAGAGAAGGMGGGMVAFFGSKLQMGIETVLDAVSFDELLHDANLVITGEGKIDGQSLRGKVVIGVARRAKKQGVAVIALVGAIGDGIEEAYAEGVSGVFSINPAPVPFSEARLHSHANLKQAADNLLRLIAAVQA